MPRFGRGFPLRAIINKQIAGGVPYTRNFTSNITASHGFAGIANHFAALNSTITASTVFTRIAHLSRPFASTITPSNLFTDIAHHLGGFTSTITVSSALTRLVHLSRPFTSNPTVSTLFTDISNHFGGFTSTITASDVFTRVTGVGRLYNSTITSSNLFSRLVALSRPFTSTITASNLFTRLVTVSRAYNSTITASNLFTDISHHVGIFSSNITASNLLSRLVHLSRPFTSTITASNLFTRVANHFGNFNSTITVLTSFTRLVHLSRPFTVTPSVSTAFTGVRTWARSFASTITPSNLFSRVTNQPPISVTATVTIQPTYSFVLTQPTPRYPFIHRDRPNGAHQSIMSASDNRVRIHNITQPNGLVIPNSGVTCQVSMVDVFGSTVLALTSMNADPNNINDLIYDIPASCFVNGNGPWYLTIEIFNQTGAVLYGTYNILAFDSPPIFVTSMDSSSSNHFELASITDGSGVVQTPSVANGFITVMAKSGTVILNNSPMSLSQGSLDIDTYPGTFIANTDPWNGAITVKDLAGVTHLTVLFTGTDENRVS